MKNANIKKINTLGKVSRIILIIVRVCLIIEIVACLIATIAFCTLPKSDVVTANGTVSAQIKVDCDQLPSIFSDELIDLDENDIDFDAFGTGVKWLVEKNKVNGDLIYDIEGKLDIDNSSSVILGAVGTFAIGAVLGAVMLVIVIFGGKFAKSLEICNSPFEENVRKSMKRFAFSLIPLAISELSFSIGNFEFGWHGAGSFTTVFVIIVILMLTFIFDYGAELQQESDETL